MTTPSSPSPSRVPVWEHLSNGKRRARWLTREHVCTTGQGGCLRGSGRFYWCARFSYRPVDELLQRAKRTR